MATPDIPRVGDSWVDTSGSGPVRVTVVHMPTPEPDTLIDLAGYHPDDEDDPVWALTRALTSTIRLFSQPDNPTRFRAIKHEELLGPLAWRRNPAERPPGVIAFQAENQPAVFAAAAAVMHTQPVRTMFQSYVDWIRAGASASDNTATQRRVEQTELLAGLTALGMPPPSIIPYLGYEGDLNYCRADVVDTRRLRARGSVAVLQSLSPSSDSGGVLWPLIRPGLVRLRRGRREQWWQAQLDRTEALLQASYPGLLHRVQARYQGTPLKPPLTQMRERGLVNEARVRCQSDLTSIRRRWALRLGLTT